MISTKIIPYHCPINRAAPHAHWTLSALSAWHTVTSTFPPDHNATWSQQLSSHENIHIPSPSWHFWTVLTWFQVHWAVNPQVMASYRFTDGPNPTNETLLTSVFPPKLTVMVLMSNKVEMFSSLFSKNNLIWSLVTNNNNKLVVTCAMCPH